MQIKIYREPVMEGFQWPWEYNFPPFFTLQIHEETKSRQLDVWCDLFLKYMKYLNKYTLQLSENGFPLYHNVSLRRSLSPDMVLTILERLEESGHAQPRDKNKRRQEWLIYWHTLDEYGHILYRWVLETGQTNTVCTLFELTNPSEGDGSVAPEFLDMDESVLLLVLRRLEEKSKCELIDMDGNYGVKFF